LINLACHTAQHRWAVMSDLVIVAALIDVATSRS